MAPVAFTPAMPHALRRTTPVLLALVVVACGDAGGPGASPVEGSQAPASAEAAAQAVTAAAPRDLQRLRTAALMQLALDPAVRTEAFATAFEGDQLVVTGTTATAEELAHAAALLARLPESGRIVVRGAGNSPVVPAAEPAPELRDPNTELAAPVALATRRAVEPTLAPAEGSGGGAASAADRAASGDRPRTWRVRPGETLSLIAARTMGDGNQWQRLYEYNRATIGANPERLREGMELRIPQD